MVAYLEEGVWVALEVNLMVGMTGKIIEQVVRDMMRVIVELGKAIEKFVQGRDLYSQSKRFRVGGGRKGEKNSKDTQEKIV